MLRTWRDHSNAGISKRPVGVYAGSEKILVGTDHHCASVTECIDRARRRHRYRTICVHALLIRSEITNVHDR